MSVYKSVEEDEYFENIIGVDFENTLPLSDMGKLLKTIFDVLANESDMGDFFEGISLLEITPNGVVIGFRFPRGDKMIAKYKEAGDKITHRQVHFIRHMFAIIDSVHKLGEVPQYLSPRFRLFIELPDYDTY
jgi:hypothetical protein